MEFFVEKQNQLYMYLQHIGFSTWDKINNICNDLVKSLSDENIKDYGAYPIFKLFYPLVYNGIVEPTIDTMGFVIAPRVPFFEGEVDPKNFLTHFNDKNNIMDNYEVRLNASKLLNRYPTLENKIKKEWGDRSLDICRDIYIRKNLYNLSNSKDSNLPLYCIYKKNHNYYSDDYIKIENSNYKIPNIFDALNIARTFIRIKNKEDFIFSYNEKNQTLEFSHYNEIPLIIYRALIMYDTGQLKNKDIYTLNRNKLPFQKVPKDAYENLKRIYSLEK